MTLAQVALQNCSDPDEIFYADGCSESTKCDTAWKPS